MKYQQTHDGEWVAPLMRGYRMKCCDCGLVHRFDFRIVGRRVLFRAFRQARATAAARRPGKFQKIGGKWRRY